MRTSFWKGANQYFLRDFERHKQFLNFEAATEYNFARVSLVLPTKTVCFIVYGFHSEEVPNISASDQITPVPDVGFSKSMRVLVLRIRVKKECISGRAFHI